MVQRVIRWFAVLALVPATCFAPEMDFALQCTAWEEWTSVDMLERSTIVMHSCERYGWSSLTQSSAQLPTEDAIAASDLLAQLVN